METKNEMQKTEPVSPNQMIQLAIENNADLEKVEKLLDLKDRYDANEARKVFASDFSVVQANMGVVIKTAVNPQTHSKYAKLEGVIEVSKPVYTKQGFSIIFYEGKAEIPENIRVYADVLHKAGHKETYHFDVPLDGVGIKGNANMTKIHGKASSVSYGRRYLLCMIWNIPTQDDDGNGAKDKKPIKMRKPNEKEQGVIDAICQDLEVIAKEGFVPDKDRITGLLWSPKREKYPDDESKITKTTAWLIDPSRPEIWKKAEQENGNTQS